MGHVKIFISSVRTGLENERDSLPGLIKALKHEPVRFEDFSAQSMPSRQACIEGVESSDAYLLLLGSNYGHIFPETGQSATHDEWITAERLGLPRYVFKKSGVTFEPEQLDFIRQLGDYGSGRFYKEFADTPELMQGVAAAVHEMSTAPSALTFRELDAAVEILWLEPSTSNRSYSSMSEPLLEIHIVPLNAGGLSARLLEQIAERLATQMRSSGLVTAHEALEPVQQMDHVAFKAAPPTPMRWDDASSGSLASVRVHKSGQIAVAFRLPKDRMGSILDPQDLTSRVAAALRLAGQIDVTDAQEIAVGIGLTSVGAVSLGRAGQPARSTATFNMYEKTVRLEPDEGLGRSALDRGADEVSALMARSFLRLYSDATTR